MGLCDLMVVGQMASPNQGSGAPVAPTSTPLGPEGGRAGGAGTSAAAGLHDICNALNTGIASRSLSGMSISGSE